MKYQVGKCDFPWAYNSRCTHSKTRLGGGVSAQYQTITNKEALEIWAPWVSSLFDSSKAICFFWCVWPKLPFCLDFIEACGFKYATLGFDWVKTTSTSKLFSGPGNYTASNSEPCLIGVRGSMPPIQKLVKQGYETWDLAQDWDCVSQCIKHERLSHSEKPSIFTQKIDLMYPEFLYGRAIGLFERKPQGKRWDVFGDQVENSIPGPVLNNEID